MVRTKQTARHSSETPAVGDRDINAIPLRPLMDDEPEFSEPLERVESTFGVTRETGAEEKKAEVVVKSRWEEAYTPLAKEEWSRTTDVFDIRKVLYFLADSEARLESLESYSTEWFGGSVALFKVHIDNLYANLPETFSDWTRERFIWAVVNYPWHYIRGSEFNVMTGWLVVDKGLFLSGIKETNPFKQNLDLVKTDRIEELEQEVERLEVDVARLQEELRALKEANGGANL